MSPYTNGIPLRVICMDCKVVMHESEPGALESHGLCLGCFTLRMRELDKVTQPADRSAE